MNTPTSGTKLNILKKGIKKILLVIGTTLLFNGILMAQKLTLQTNKQIYVAGEEIGFKCTLTLPKDYVNSILFVDICGENYLITSQVLKPANGTWDGRIALPDTLQTGVYLLRTYIGNPKGIPVVAAKPVSIINRFMNNEINTVRKNKEGYLALDMRGSPEPLNNELLKISANVNSVTTNHDINFTINNNIADLFGNISLAVYKTEKQSLSVPVEQYPYYTPSNLVRTYNYLVLSGKLTQQSNNTPVENETILLSTPDSIPNINYAYTDESGEFRFVLNNFYGTQDIIIQSLSKQNNFAINLYPVLLLPPQKIPYYIPEEVEQSEFVQLAIKRATMHLTYSKHVEVTKIHHREVIPFYGHTNTRIYPGHYIPLDDFAEIAWEILPTVKYKHDKDSTYLTIWNPENKAFYSNPWVLVDGIPIYDLSTINPLNSERINWIEIQPQMRCYGDILVEGMINIKTKNCNFTDVELPKNAVRTNIETFYITNSQVQTDESVFKDLLYWNPEVRSTGKTNITVTSSYEKGHYVAVARACDQNGEIYRSVVKFNVE